MANTSTLVLPVFPPSRIGRRLCRTLLTTCAHIPRRILIMTRIGTASAAMRTLSGAPGFTAPAT
jgi:hypothetical protein